MDAFFTQERRVRGVRVRAPAPVEPAALDEAGRRLERLLGSCPAIAANLLAAGAELQLVGRDQRVTDLPQYRHLAGVRLAHGRTLDERARAYGGLAACVGEEGLLRLPTARHRDHRDLVAHELAHTALDYGLDAPLRRRVERAHLASRARWDGAYAATSAHEWFAELTMWWAGSRGDHGTLAAPPADGPEGLRAFDPAGYAVVDAVWSGRWAPAPVRWVELAPRRVRRSGPGRTPAVVVFDNPTAAPAERRWLDGSGREVAYGVVPAGEKVGQPTWVTHAWVVDHPELGRRGPFVAGRSPGRVTLA